MKRPIKTGEDGRDPATGRFLEGNPGGPGRPRAIDLRKTAQEQASLRGTDLELELWAVLEALFRKAREGDVSAAKLLFDKLTARSDELPLVHIDQRGSLHARRNGQDAPLEPPGPPVPPTRELIQHVIETAWCSGRLDDVVKDERDTAAMERLFGRRRFHAMRQP